MNFWEALLMIIVVGGLIGIWFFIPATFDIKALMTFAWLLGLVAFGIYQFTS